MRKSQVNVSIIVMSCLAIIVFGIIGVLCIKTLSTETPTHQETQVDKNDYVYADSVVSEPAVLYNSRYFRFVYSNKYIENVIAMAYQSDSNNNNYYYQPIVRINFKTGYNRTTTSFVAYRHSKTYTFSYDSTNEYWKCSEEYSAPKQSTTVSSAYYIDFIMPIIPCSTTLSFDSNGGSSVSSKTVTCDTAIGSLTTPTRSGYTFAGWFVDGLQISSTTYYTYDGPRTAFARWEKNDTGTTSYTLSSSTNNAEYGTIIGASSSVQANSNVLLNAVPKTNYEFSYWTINNAYTSTQNPLEFTMTANTTVQAVFQEKNISSFSISYASGSGTYSVEQTDNDYALITFTPTAGQYIYSVRFDDGTENYIEYYNGSITNCGANVLYATYLANNNDNKNVLKLGLYYILGSGTITVQTQNVPLDLKENLGGTSINGVAVKSSTGGEARLVGNEEEVVLIAQPYAGYEFLYWEGSRSGQFSDSASQRILQEDFDGEVITAVFGIKSSSQTNGTTDLGSSDFL